MQKKITPRLIYLALPGLMFILANAQAQSLDRAVNQQLENVAGEGPCARLLSAGGEPVGKLQDICARAVPVGATPSTSGGGSATPATIPNADSGAVHAAEKSSKYQFTSSSGQWNLFFTAENEALDRNTSVNEDGFDSSLNRLLLGGSYLIGKTVTINLALNVSEHEGDFLQGGNFSSDAKGLRLVGSFKPTEKLSIQLAAAYDDVESRRRRIASFVELFNQAPTYSTKGSPLAYYNYDQVGLSARAAYEYSSGRLSISPQVGLDWTNSAYETYGEKGDSGLELRFHNDDRKSLQGMVGFQGAFAIGTNYGAFIPQLSASLRHEFESDGRNIQVSFVEDTNSTKFSYQTDALDADFFEISAGTVFVFKNGTQAFINVQTIFGNDQYDNLIASAGMRFEL